jgi:ribosomal protein L2
MALKKMRPLTPAMRHRIVVTAEDITTATPEKSCLHLRKSQVVVTTPVK